MLTLAAFVPLSATLTVATRALLQVSHLVMRELDLLRRIFATYSADASAAGAGAAQTANTSLASIQMTVMTQQQFYKLMEDAGMYRPTINLRGKFDPKKDCTFWLQRS